MSNRPNKEIYLHVLRWWLWWDVAQRKTVSMLRRCYHHESTFRNWLSPSSCTETLSLNSSAPPLGESPLRSPWMENQHCHQMRLLLPALWPAQQVVTAWGSKFIMHLEEAWNATSPWHRQTLTDRADRSQRRRTTWLLTNPWDEKTLSLSRTKAGAHEERVLDIYRLYFHHLPMFSISCAFYRNHEW